VLAQEAAAGSGASYAALYDRYESQVFNYCLRLLNSQEDAADATQEAFVGVLRRLQSDESPVLDFPSYLFTAARNESYSVMRRRDRSRPTDAVPEEPGTVASLETDPERSALLHDVQEEVRAANARLAPRHREVLALREVAGRSYDEIAAILGISANAAAQLLWRARSKLRGELRMGAIASVAAGSEDCERAQLLIGMREDGEHLDELDDSWLDEHLDQCGSCRASRAMLLEVGASYRCWLPVAALVGMRHDVLMRAGEVVGADWSGVAAAGKHASKSGPGTGTIATAGGVATIAAVGLALGVLQKDGPQEQRATSNPADGSTPLVSAGAGAAKARAPVARSARASRRAGTPAGAEGAVGEPRSGGRSEQIADPPAAVDLPPAPQPGGGGGPPERRRAPGPPAAPAPRAPATTPAPPPPARPPTVCTHPSGGPPGCPPGHGGTPPGQGGTPPGLGTPPPGHRR